MANVSFSNWTAINLNEFTTSLDTELQNQLSQFDSLTGEPVITDFSSTQFTGFWGPWTAVGQGSNFGSSSAIVTSILLVNGSNSITLAGSVGENGGVITALSVVADGFHFSETGSISLNSNFDFVGGTINSVSVSFDGHSASFAGSVTINSNGDFTGGTITSFSFQDAGGHKLSVSGISISYSSFDALTNTDLGHTDLTDLFNTLNFNGNDIITAGLGDDSLSGGAGNDSLSGGDGNDTLDGGIGVDTLAGGNGDDVYIVNATADQVIEALNHGNDLVQASASYTLSANLENLTLTGSAAINGVGNASANILTGNAAANILNGGAGIDTLIGGDGNDTYVLDQEAELSNITENTGEGTDLIQIAYANASTTVAKVVDLSLFANLAAVENVSVSGTGLIDVTGNDLDNVITGNASKNTLTGGLGNDTLNGGTGIDTLIGGDGNDTYVLDQEAELSNITENTGEGTDLIQIAYANASTTVAKVVDLSLFANLADVENVTVTGTGLFNVTGNDLDNVITGNAAANLLNGGTGADTLIGGLGNDIYVVDDAGDTVTELLSQGLDTVRSSIDYTLAANVENLTLTGAAVSGTGNSLNNVITGNAGNNTLDGGAGNDTLIGGAGDDTYLVDLKTTGTGTAAVASLQDAITELANQGTDTLEVRGSAVLTSASTLTLGATLENLDVSATGTTLLNLTGNALNNTLVGNDADNILKGGLGNDSLFGGDGNDTLWGEGGNDTLDGGEGVDYYVLDNIDDVVMDTGSADVFYLDTVLANFSVDLTVQDYIGIEYINLQGIQNLSAKGNELANHLSGNSGANLLDGRGGNDELLGGGGNDTLNGGEGDDYLYGELNAFTGLVNNTSKDILIGDAGNDTLIGGAGADTLTGGADADTFIYMSITESQAGAATRDVITDFTSGEDIIDLVNIDANAVVAGNQGFDFIGDSAFSHAAGQLRFDAGSVFGDTNGDGAADFEIHLQGIASLSSTDFML
jgi:Ca2+-binding RTX toxin-like protein